MFDLTSLSSSTCMTPLGVTAAAVVVGAAAVWWIKSKSKTEVIDMTSKSEVQLLEMESSMVMMDQVAITTITFVKGDPSTTSTFLQQRVASIVAANPWLTGRLVRRKGRKGCFLVWDTTKLPSHFHSYPHNPSDAPMSREIAYEDVYVAANKRGMVLKKGMDSVGRDQDLFRVSLVPDSSQPTKRFVVVVSMCHVIGDGHTFYSVHNMLSSTASVSALDPTRQQAATEEYEKAMGSEMGLPPSPSGWLIANMMWGMVRILFGYKARAKVYYVNEEHVAKCKEAAVKEGRVGWVSTNDVVTSEILKTPYADTCMMAVNFRNKVPSASYHHAGNYENLLLYRPPDVQSPSLIRLSVSSLRRASSPPTTLIEGPRRLGEKMTCVTNWSSFDKGLELAGCDTDLHIPLYDFVSATSPVFFIGIVFRPCKGKLALLLLGSQRDMSEVEKMGVVGEKLDVVMRGSE